MPYEYEVETRVDYLYAKLIGRETLVDNKQSARDLVAICKERELRMIIVDLRWLEGGPTMIENYEFAQFLPDVLAPQIKRCATVFREENREAEEFLETAAMNRGVVFRAFSSIESAEAWLRS